MYNALIEPTIHAILKSQTTTTAQPRVLDKRDTLDCAGRRVQEVGVRNRANILGKLTSRGTIDKSQAKPHQNFSPDLIIIRENQVQAA